MSRLVVEGILISYKSWSGDFSDEKLYRLLKLLYYCYLVNHCWCMVVGFLLVVVAPKVVLLTLLWMLLIARRLCSESMFWVHMIYPKLLSG